MSSEKGSDWKKFLRKHWVVAVIFTVAGILAFAGAVYVFLWFVGNAQSTGIVPAILGDWTMGNLVTFILLAIFWVLLLIGIPVAVAAAAGWLWWKRLPDEEKKEYHFFDKRSRSSNGGGAVSILFWIAFAIKVFIDGNWNVAISTWSLNYVVDSIITIMVWGLIILGIPLAIGAIVWILYEMKKKPLTINAA